MAFKKNYLIKVWDTSKKKDKELDKQIETENDGFDLIQERIIKCYETNIKNLSVPKGLRATYEEVKEKITTPIVKKNKPAIADTNR
jgi:hypothetical protein